MKVDQASRMNERKAVGNQGPGPSTGPANRFRSSLPWRSLEQQVVRMQKQIAQASQRGDRQAVHTLQQRLMESEAARLLAVRRVAEENQGKHTAGVDGVKSLNARERLAMASLIHPTHWDHQPPLPVRRVWVKKPGTSQQRPLAILPMIDRCKQALVKLALEPEWEVQFEPHSYGFRPGRGTHDAIVAILVAIEGRPAFVFDADIEAAFDHVNQAALLDKLHTFPLLRQAISAWLKAGVMEGDTYAPSEIGLAQGGVLSPLLMNIALHGIEAAVMEGSANGRVRGGPLLVRYADDFVIVHTNLKELQQAVRRVSHWLAAMGLQLHAHKTRMTHTLTPYQGQVGFDFLGFHMHQEIREKAPGGERREEEAPWLQSIATTLWHRLAPQDPVPEVKTIIAPSEEATRRHLATIEHKLQQLQTAPQAHVIQELNPLIAGWAGYYNGLVPATTMSRYDALLELRLLHWASKRHPGKSPDWLRNRYWRRAGKHRRIFATDEVQLRPYRQASILSG